MSTDPGKTHHVGDGCQPAHDPRIDQTPPEVWPHPTYIELERQVEQLQSALAVSEQQTADAEELWRADVERLQAAEAECRNSRGFVAAENERLRASLSEMLESFTEPEDDNDILRRARAALGDAKASK
jgi:hypothetical protein